MRFTTALLLVFITPTLGACGGVDDVEVVLPFVGNVMAKGKVKEAKMDNRGTLVLPPTATTLPAPVSEEQAVSTQSWPVDPDQKAKQDAKIAALKEKQYKREGDWKGERNSGNGLEDFNNKVDWSKRQTGIFQPTLKQD